MKRRGLVLLSGMVKEARPEGLRHLGNVAAFLKPVPLA